jgi:hypothetical protein
VDIYCPKCGEPWDNDTIHDVADARNTTYAVVSRDFRRRGCEAIGTSHNEATIRSTRADYAAIAYHILGDDMDGASSMVDDADYFGLLGE